MHQQSAHSHERFADPKGHAEIKDQDSVIEADSQQDEQRDRWRRQEIGEPSFERKVDGEGNESDHSPPDIVGEGHTEMKARIRVVINLPEEPAVAAEGYGIDHHIDEGKQEGRAQQHGPTGSCEAIEAQRLEQRLRDRRGLCDWEEKAESDTVGGIEQKAERNRVHEGDVEKIEFLAHGRTIVVVPPEGNAGARGRKLTDEGRDPTDHPKPPGSRPADQLDRYEQECSQKYENIGAEEDGLNEKNRKVHTSGDQ